MDAWREKDYSPRWSIQRRGLVDGWIVAIGLGDRNQSIFDYLLMPGACTDRIAIRFSEDDRVPLGMNNFETSDALVRSVSLRLTKLGQVAPTMPARPKKQSRSNQSNGTAGRGRRARH